MKIKWVLVSACVALPVSLLATAAEKFPAQCRVSGLRYEQANVLLFSQHTSKPRLYVMENTAHYPIWVTHEKKHNPGASAGWASQIMPMHWSSLLVTRRHFSLTCQRQAKSGRISTVSCSAVLRVCQFSQFFSKNPISGGYWVAESLPYAALEAHIRKRGFELPTH
ncbi:MAG: hypothetical protein COY58_06720 [Gammaproteobacteria bacterium CG_4_10_14_0_8_um_filter_38_16]|nr:MAG: hypothetical protein COY58_06720 [Gammaproteobacteria bacterium CG_4_10_14_0_8_um_filter_38_16]PJA03730.1 MAG: hypothetical protein COX72_03695 [Gammaproteobacteria bacterium CG_4_10_14_0_2_um_filter_38_22]PJB09907.1 MAG: hypothetical protein CO120_07540 [Gammaproteobacteria bacterium CG_4_9_14_3_um_filter_38_9]